MTISNKTSNSHQIKRIIPLIVKQNHQFDAINRINRTQLIALRAITGQRRPRPAPDVGGGPFLGPNPPALGVSRAAAAAQNSHKLPRNPKKGLFQPKNRPRLSFSAALVPAAALGTWIPGDN